MQTTIQSINPANESIVEEFPNWSMQEINPVIDDVHQAFKAWRKLSFSRRAVYFNQMAVLLRERK